MKYILVILLICFGTYSEKAYSVGNFPATSIAGHDIQQQEPFYFVNPIPPAKKLLDNIDLSFFKNRLAVSTYRYRIQIPNGAETSIDRRLSVWSGWTRSDLTEIKIPRLDLEGGYKLIVEYNMVEGTEIRRFEVPFYVYYSSPERTASNAAYTEKSITGQGTREIKPSAENSTEKMTGSVRTSLAEEKTERVTLRSEPLKTASANRTSRKNDPLRDLSAVRIAVNTKPQVIAIQQPVPDINESKPVYPDIVSEINDSLLMPEEAIDTVFIAESLAETEQVIPVETGSTEMNDTTRDSIDNVSKAGPAEIMALPVNTSDSDSNSELHRAILSGQNDYAMGLISGMTDLNQKNNSGFAPLHIAVMLNNDEIVRYLIIKGADINAAGNTGYTPLHIASELNYLNTASELLYNGARTDKRTDQGLTPRMIARIQGNTDLVKLLSAKDSAFLAFHRTSPDSKPINMMQELTDRNFQFNLPYDNTLVRKRKFNNVLRFIAAPVFIIGTSGYVSFKSKANHNFSLSKIAETEAMAKNLYDKGVRFNRTANITGGVSIVSVYGIIHTSLRKKSITTKMTKVF